MTAWFSYSAGVCFSAVLHGVLLLVLILGWQVQPEPKKLVRPQYINATLLEIKPRSQPKVKAPIRPVEDKAAKQRREKQLAIQRQQKQARLEAERKQKLAKERAAKARAEKERVEKQRAEERRIERERMRKVQEQSLLEALAEEEAFLESEHDTQLISSYSAYIQERVVNNWSRPASARRGMVAELSIQLVPTGRVVSVVVAKSSGNEAFDRSAERAVRKVDRFERLQELSRTSPGLFEREFRRFRLVFKPEDLRL